MKLKWISLVCAFAAAFVFIPALSRADVKDNASIFSKQAVDDADRAMKKMKEKHNKEFVVETFSAIPDDQKDNYTQHPDTFFKDWMAARAKELKVNGVYALICMDPHHLEVGAGKNTISRGDFTQADVDGLYSQMKESLKAKDYDKALTDAVDTVERAYTANISEPNSRSSYNQRETGYSGGNNRSYGSGFPSNLPTHTSSTGLGFGTIICFVVGAVIIFSLIKSIFRGNSGGGYNQGGWGQGGNYGGGNYGNQSYGGGFGGGGGGGGFGRGFLGGLLGGALGGYAADQFDHRNDQSNQGGGFSQGGSFGGQSDNSGGGGGGSFDSGPSDAGQGFGDSSAGGDFSSGGGGGIGGGGGGDSGGSSGGDF
jgi:hypothetical protein